MFKVDLMVCRFLGTLQSSMARTHQNSVFLPMTYIKRWWTRPKTRCVVYFLEPLKRFPNKEVHSLRIGTVVCALPLEWTLQAQYRVVVSLSVGRQNTAWKTFGYIPTDWVDPSGSTGLPTREASRALEYAVNDFAVRQAAIALNKPASDIATYANRSMNFVNHWDASVTSDGFNGFSQRRYPVGLLI